MTQHHTRYIILDGTMNHVTSNRKRRLCAVTFDLWQTLIYDDMPNARRRAERRVAAITKVLADAGIAFPPESVAAADSRVYEECRPIWERLQEVSTRGQLEILLRLLDERLLANLDGEAWRRLELAYVECVFCYPPSLSPHARTVLSDLKTRGYCVGLICNTGRTPGWALRRLLDDWGILHLFDDLAFSNEEGIRKPHPDIFIRELNRLSVLPQEAVHIGDDPVADIQGARGVGMHAVWVHPDPATDAPADICVGSIAQVLGAVEELARDCAS